ncbi:MAG TPA: questin oxidase family protein, partial [Thermoanaerobaculia bacterium]|nr:questin oxidase family protein [Thermoanaerobaculia bacterium]
DARLRQFAAFYEKRLRLQAPGESLPNDDWREALGQRRYESALAAKFDEDLRSRGSIALLRDVVPHLTSGLASEAFHGAIRLAYAVDSGDDVDLAGSLAAWVTGFSEMHGAPAEKRFDRAIDAFGAIAADDRFGAPLEGRSIDARLAKVNALPSFDDYRSSIANVALPDLAMIAARIFIATGDFVALHLVTACHAVRVLQPFLAPSALDILANAMLAAYIAIGRPPLATEIIDEATDLASRAVTSDDDHDLKLVYCCLQEEAHYNSGLHRTAAVVRLRGHEEIGTQR